MSEYIKSGKEMLDYLAKYMEVARSVKAVVLEYYPKAKVYVFGSVVEGKVTAVSDIDLLVVCDAVGEQASLLKVNIRRRVGIDVLVQIHIASVKEFEQWYTRFVGKIIEV